GDEHLRTCDDLEAARMVLADPGLVVVEFVEQDQQIHVALEREQRIFMRRMERREKHAGAHITVAGVGHASPTISTCRRRGPCAPRMSICAMSAEREGPVIRLIARGSASMPKLSRTRAHTVS